MQLITDARKNSCSKEIRKTHWETPAIVTFVIVTNFKTIFRFYTPENDRKPMVYRRFQGIWKCNIGLKCVKVAELTLRLHSKRNSFQVFSYEFYETFQGLFLNRATRGSWF